MKEALYNLDGLRQICGDNTADIREFIHLFIQTTGDSVNEIKAHMDAGDRASIAEVLHRVRPSVQIFGMDTLTAEMKMLEDSFRAGNSRGDEHVRLLMVLEQLGQVFGRLAEEAKNIQ